MARFTAIAIVLLSCATFVAATSPWTKLIDKAPWGTRTQVAEHSTLLGRLYVIGGRSWHFNNDVWVSDDGSSWEQLAAKAPWQARSYHSVVEVDGSLLLIGGSGFGFRPRAGFLKFFSDTWRSDDGGKTWQMIADNLPWGMSPQGQKGRAGHFAVNVNGTVILFGGNYAEFGATYYGDVWRSDDKGVTWHCVNAKTPWFGRVALQVVVMPDGKLVIIGGDNFRLGNYTAATDVWHSDDLGKSWVKVAETPFAPRSGNKCVHYQGRILCIGGITGKPRSNASDTCPHKASCLLHDVWQSLDAGKSWTEVTTASGAWGCDSSSGSCGRFDFGIAIKGNDIFTIGGDAETTLPKELNSVWKLSLSSLGEVHNSVVV